ncbi:HD-GYP domain-containing protein (plasmid) [Rhizobium acidisoli]|uniref:HD-GYP domain-containing protein n=1 Tax=Rhizobium acidisoli TaxID=1538158 RepID=A0AAE5WTM4_9HYPH|nr:HD-GYP domain-containing protein [Rhizobium acidisoli]KPH06187.1 HD family phosphohydrolase [Rhizobium acidisoli]QAS82204.1 HD-GYP domain-containing protein [Rhizobium acidisoli]
MQKRIQVNQLRVGMFVEDVELGGHGDAVRCEPFLIRSNSDVRRIIASHVKSVVINVAKGIDLDRNPAQGEDAASYEARLLVVFTPQEIGRARQSIREIDPHLRQVLSDARLQACFADGPASTAVERIMSASLDNAGALIAVAKLKEKDEVTFLHSLAVSALMVAFGRSLGHSEDDIRLLGLGGLVHDLGKMTLSDDILTKTGKLTAEEMELVRRHPQLGYEMLSRAGTAPKEVLDICRYHHERYEGGGYPGRLSGRSIPYVARLAAICDVYEALTTIRPYKRAFSQTEAINMMMNSPGHFDAKLLSAFVSKMAISGTIH